MVGDMVVVVWSSVEVGDIEVDVKLNDGLVGIDDGLVGVPDCEVGLTDGGLVDCVVMR